jgi:hypothetical protein
MEKMTELPEDELARRTDVLKKAISDAFDPDKVQADKNYQATVQYLTERFQKYTGIRNREAWLVHEYDNSGAGYGLILTHNGNGGFRLLTYTDSGYSPEWEIIHHSSSGQVWRMIECLQPTNPNYKYNS